MDRLLVGVSGSVAVLNLPSYLATYARNSQARYG
jgi:hypothetical protein